jgi:hypothetical protein
MRHRPLKRAPKSSAERVAEIGKVAAFRERQAILARRAAAKDQPAVPGNPHANAAQIELWRRNFAAEITRSSFRSRRSVAAMRKPEPAAIYIDRYVDMDGETFYAVNFCSGDGGWQSDPFYSFVDALIERDRLFKEYYNG